MSAVHVPGVDLDTLARWMDARGLGVGPLAEASLITGGTQNVLLRFTRAGRTFVLRRPPVHKRANSDETMRREARVLAALAGSDVPHPGLIAAEPDPEVMGAAFYLMEPVDGFNPTLGLPAPFEHDTGWQHAMGLSMADAIVALAAVDHVAVGLGDLGRFDGWATSSRPLARSSTAITSCPATPGRTSPVLGWWASGWPRTCPSTCGRA